MLLLLHQQIHIYAATAVSSTNYRFEGWDTTIYGTTSGEAKRKLNLQLKQLK